MNLFRLFVTGFATGMIAAPAAAVDIFTPGLPASPEQNLTCRVVNATLLSQVVTTQALDSKGVTIATSVQNLAPGEAGGFAVAGQGGATYCKFSVNAHPSGFRASIEVFEILDSGNFKIVAALPGQ